MSCRSTKRSLHAPHGRARAVPGSARRTKSFYAKQLDNSAQCFKSDPGGSNCQNHRTLQWLSAHHLRPFASLSQLRFQPIPTASDVDDQRNGELCGPLHLLPDQGGDRFHLRSWHLEDQLVVHL